LAWLRTSWSDTWLGFICSYHAKAGSRHRMTSAINTTEPQDREHYYHGNKPRRQDACWRVEKSVLLSVTRFVRDPAWCISGIIRIRALDGFDKVGSVVVQVDKRPSPSQCKPPGVIMHIQRLIMQNVLLYRCFRPCRAIRTLCETRGHCYSS
jgi:hypothetical protein